MLILHPVTQASTMEGLSFGSKAQLLPPVRGTTCTSMQLGKDSPNNELHNASLYNSSSENVRWVLRPFETASKLEVRGNAEYPAPKMLSDRVSGVCDVAMDNERKYVQIEVNDELGKKRCTSENKSLKHRKNGNSKEERRPAQKSLKLFDGDTEHGIEVPLPVHASIHTSEHHLLDFNIGVDEEDGIIFINGMPYYKGDFEDGELLLDEDEEDPCDGDNDDDDHDKGDDEEEEGDPFWDEFVYDVEIPDEYSFNAGDDIDEYEYDNVEEYVYDVDEEKNDHEEDDNDDDDAAEFVYRSSGTYLEVNASKDTLERIASMLYDMDYARLYSILTGNFAEVSTIDLKKGES